MNDHDLNDSSFDLLIHDWIPCVGMNRQDEPVFRSIRWVLEHGHEIRAIEHESPPVRIAVLRLLLALCYRVAHANGLPLNSFRNWRKLRDSWGEGISSEWIDRYLDACHCRDRFRLFDDAHPFFQVAELKFKGGKEPEPATRLAFEQFAGTPSSLWEHWSEVPSVREAALYLVTCQAFGASASNTSDVVIGNVEYSPTGRTFAPAYTGYTVWLEGDNLLETLLLNLVDYDQTDADLPIWEKPLTGEALRARQPRKAKEGDVDNKGRQIKVGKKLGNYKAVCPTGPVQLYTWPSRAVRLTEPKNGRVETVFFTQGLALSDRQVDPMKPYDQDGRPINLDSRKAAWRDLHSLLALQPISNRTVLALSQVARSGLPAARLNIAGIARGDNAAKILFWRHERMPVPIALLGDVNLIERLGGLLLNAELAAREQHRRAWRIARFYRVPADRPLNKKEKEDVDALAREIDPRSAYWARLENYFSALLMNLPNDWDTNGGDWKPDDQQEATFAWRCRVKSEARCALEDSARSLGTSARAVQAVARVHMGFSDNDIKPQPQNAANAGTGEKGGKSK